MPDGPNAATIALQPEHHATRLPGIFCKVILAEGINVRSGLDLSSPVVKLLPLGEVFEVLERKTNLQGVVRLRTDDGWTSERSAINGDLVIAQIALVHQDGPKQQEQAQSAVDVNASPSATDSCSSPVDHAFPSGLLTVPPSIAAEHPDVSSKSGSTGLPSTWWRLLPLEPGAFERAVFWDTETTGFCAEDEIVEIGAVEFEVVPPAAGSLPLCHLCPTGSLFHALLAPSRPIHPKAALTHGLSDQDFQSAPPREQTLRNFLRFVGGSALVAHNASFDIRFLSRELQRFGLQESAVELKQRSFCSMSAFAVLSPSSVRTLESLCYLLGVQEGAPGSAWRHQHSALADAVLGGKVLLALAARATEACGGLTVVNSAAAARLSMPWRAARAVPRATVGGESVESAEASTDCGASSEAARKRRRIPVSFA